MPNLMPCLLVLALSILSAVASTQESSLPEADPNEALQADGASIDDPAPPVGESAEVEQDRLDPVRLEAFIDGVVKAGMEDHHLPGLVISVVQGGRLILAKGYGLARLDPPQPVVADETLFRIGSISKVITFTGVMQLVEQGRLDLEADLSTVIDDVDLSSSFGGLSMIDLMTHSAGFEDSYVGHFFADGPDTDHAPVVYLNRFQPHRVRAPGEQIVYSNYGVMLAGHVLAVIAGQPFADYADEHVFQPLGMNHSSFREYPLEERQGYLPRALAEARAMGYTWTGSGYQAADMAYMHRASYPAGSVSSTATDMARFMLAHLGGGQLQGRAILRPDTVAQMHHRLRGNAPGIAGNAHGFWVNQIRGYDTIEHGGAVLGFLSDLVLIPELDFGIFVSTNGDAGRGVVTSLPRRVVEEFYPAKQERPEPDPAFAQRGKAYSGRYLANRRGVEIIDKLAALGSEIEVSVSPEGYLVSSENGGQRWIEVGEHLFENAVTGARIAFEVDEAGRATRLLAAYGSNTAERIPFVRSSRFFYAVTGATALFAVGALVGMWLRRGRRIPQTAGETLATVAVGLASIAWIVMLVSFGMLMALQTGPVPPILIRYPDPVALTLHWSALVASALAAIAVLGLWPVWRRQSWNLWRRSRHTVIVLTGLAMIWVLNDWNVLGFRYLGA